MTGTPRLLAEASATLRRCDAAPADLVGGEGHTYCRLCAARVFWVTTPEAVAWHARRGECIAFEEDGANYFGGPLIEYPAPLPLQWPPDE